MRYILKRPTPDIITDWIKLRNSVVPAQPIVYDEFDRKSDLNQILREDQHNICCYCQQILTHFQGNNVGGSHNEHLEPQKGLNAKPLLQMDYNNIFACCNTSKNQSRDKEHCGESKKDKLIRGFIQKPGCAGYFKYNSVGEILPNGEYNAFDDYKRNKEDLPIVQKEALEAILTLNLNYNILVLERKKDQTKLFEMLVKLSKEKIDELIQTFEKETNYQRFIDMLLYYMRKKK